MGRILRRALAALTGRFAAPAQQPAAVRDQETEIALLKAELAKTQQALAASTELLTSVSASIGSLAQVVSAVSEIEPGAAAQKRIQGPLAEVLQLSAHRQARNDGRSANAGPLEGN